ncbi:hypothetical protein ACTA71_009492 [Dictyostelium dimigraforme]
MIFQRILNTVVFNVVQRKLVDKLANNKQFQQMSVQFRDKMDEMTSEKPAKGNTHNHNNNNFQNIKYSDDIYENARLYEQQTRLQQQQNSYNSSSNKPQRKNYFTNLYESFKEEINDETDKFNGKKK